MSSRNICTLRDITKEAVRKTRTATLVLANEYTGRRDAIGKLFSKKGQAGSNICHHEKETGKSRRSEKGWGQPDDGMIKLKTCEEFDMNLQEI